MNLISLAAVLDVAVAETIEQSALIFVEDSDYEFVGGGNAANGY